MADGSRQTTLVSGVALAAAMLAGAAYLALRPPSPAPSPEAPSEAPAPAQAEVKAPAARAAPEGPTGAQQAAAAPAPPAAATVPAATEPGVAATEGAAQPEAAEATTAGAVAAPEAAAPAGTTGDEAAATAPPPPMAEAAGAAPGLDVVRVEPDGSAAVAGTAEPGAKVTIMADAAPVAEAEADASGKFVAIFKVEPSVAPRALSLEAQPAGGGQARPSDDVVVLLPHAPTGAAAAVPSGQLPPPEPSVAPDGATVAAAAAPAEVASAPTPVPVVRPGMPYPRPARTVVAAAAAVGAPAPQVAAAEMPTAPEVAATAVLRGDSVEVTPTRGAPKGLTLTSISYSEAGDVTLAGLANANAVLRAYVDDRFAEEARAGGDGRWKMDLGGVAGGVYRLRIDELGADGKVAGRVETPFQRDYPHAPPPRPGVPGAAEPASVENGTVTVQPGNNLWTLARTHYGSGVMYTQIFTANREQIRNPDLIYPGQILAMPDGAVE
ncbi:MAG: LysM peptidoglycan-binding domain-containing protein [Amaricoccus sp.]